MGEILKVIDSLPYVFEYIVPGMIFMLTYRRLAPSGKQVADTIFYLSSVIVSVVVESVVNIALAYMAFNVDQRIILLISCIICMIAAIILATFKGQEWFSNLSGRFFIKSTNDNIWASLIDFQSGSYLYLYLKNGASVEGYIREIEEKGNDSWIALQSYEYKKEDLRDGVQDLLKDRPDYYAYVMVRVSDIEHAVIVNKR